jgi:hypothetical protein
VREVEDRLGEVSGLHDAADLYGTFILDELADEE